MQEIHISMQEDTLLVCRKTGKTGEDSNAEYNGEHRLLTDIQNQMYKATIKYRLSRVDQENVASKVKAWTSTNEGDNILFRPRLHEEPDEDGTHEIIDDGSDDGKEEPVYLTRHTKGHVGKTLLFVLAEATPSKIR